MSDNERSATQTGADRRAGLNRVKLLALTRDHAARLFSTHSTSTTPGVGQTHVPADWDDFQPVTFGSGAYLVVDEVMVSLVDPQPGTPIGEVRTEDVSGSITSLPDDSVKAKSLLAAALAVALGAEVGVLHLLVDEKASLFADLSVLVDFPVWVWQIHGRDLILVSATPSGNSILESAVPIDAPELVGLMEQVGLRVVVEADHLAGEWLGLEVARIERDPTGQVGLSVGVGRFDREFTSMLHAHLSPIAALERVADRGA